MARALRATSGSPSAAGQRSTGRSTRSQPGAPARRTTPATRQSPQQTPRKITTRTPRDRARHSPIARVVNRRDAPTRLRRFIFMSAAAALAAITLMMLVVVFQTRLAETQLGIDDIEAQITAERSRYDQLRLERSILREPGRLSAEARALGMVPGSKAEFRSVDPLAVAEVLVATSGVDSESVRGIADSLDRYGDVKSIIGDRP